MPYRFVILAVIYLEMLVVTLGIQFIPPLLTQFISHYSLTHLQCGILMGVFSLFGLFFCIPVGLYSYRIGYREISIASFFFLIVGTAAMNFTGSFYLLCLFRVIAGVGIMTLAITLPSMLLTWFDHSEHGRAMGIFNTALPVGSIIAFVFIGRLAELIGVSMIIWLIIVVALIGLVFFILLYRVPTEDKPSKGSIEKYSIIEFLKIEKNAWWLGAIWLFYNAATISFSTFAIVFFYGAGHSIIAAGLIASTVVAGPLVLSPILGVFIDRGIDVLIVLIVGNIVLFAGFVGLYFGVSIYISLPILGLGAGLIPTAVYCYVPRVVRPQKTAICFGMVMAMLNAGVLLGPYIVGFFMDHSNVKRICFFVMAVLSILAVYPAYKLKRSMRETIITRTMDKRR